MGDEGRVMTSALQRHRPSSSSIALRLIFTGSCVLVSAFIVDAVDDLRGLLGLLLLLPALTAVWFDARWSRRRALLRFGVLLFCCFALTPVLALTLEFTLARVAGTALLIVGVVLMVKQGTLRERLAGIRTLHPHARVFERGEMQFSAGWSAHPRGPGEFVEVLFVIQNCVDVVRAFRIDVSSKHASFNAFSHQQSIDPGCIVEVVISICVPGDLIIPVNSMGVFEALVDAKAVVGAQGVRVRHAVGEHWISPSTNVVGTNIAGGVMLATIGVGSFVTGRHGVVTVPVDTSRPASVSASTPRVRELYRPSAEDLLAGAQA